ncbi:hypothetical protein [Luteolibacter marinus]|uniref:hypothetical protein n=1 Tax=Luteolibacter marinus TaxID=2776705 RepID=UPI001866E54C|nr:hypothetical protein [Luteolibacter marinus]
MKYAPNIAGGLLGFLFVASSLVVLLNLVPEQPAPPEGSPAAMFMGAFIPTGYMTFVKVLELAGGLLVAIPRTRNFGLLVLGPIILNIVAFHVFITNGAGIFEPPFMIPVICVLALYLLWAGRKAFAGLARPA